MPLLLVLLLPGVEMLAIASLFHCPVPCPFFPRLLPPALFLASPSHPPTTIHPRPAGCQTPIIVILIIIITIIIVICNIINIFMINSGAEKNFKDKDKGTRSDLVT